MQAEVLSLKTLFRFSLVKSCKTQHLHLLLQKLLLRLNPNKMKDTLLLILALLSIPILLCAQTTTHNFSLSASYNNSQYYDLSTDVTTNVNHTTWDIAFSVIGSTDGGIFINEGTGFNGTAVQLFHIPNKGFSDNITTADLGPELLNKEGSWKKGAFNTLASSSATDYGWGTYSFINHQINGGSVLYAVLLRDGSYRKVVIDNLSGGIYTFRYANLDGTNAQQQTVNKANFAGQTLAYFSFGSNSTVTVEPSDWDWVFTRYQTLLYSTNPPTAYMVSGILTNEGVSAVMADNVNPATVNHTNYTPTADSLTVIGHDWKSFNFSSGWSIAPNRVYFVQTADSNLYQIEFLSFQGSSTGQGTFAKTYLGKFISVDRIQNRILSAIKCFPNPTTDQLQIVYSLRQTVNAPQVTLTNAIGQTVHHQLLPSGKEGLNAATLFLPTLPSGFYHLTLQTGTDQYTQTIVVTQPQ